MAKKEIAQKFAPVLCCELSEDREQRIYDCFSSVKFNPDIEPWNMEDRIDEFRKMFPDNYMELEVIESSLKPSIYYSLLETESHYFLIYTVYHAYDQKRPLGHEHDMEHIQVVVRKAGEKVEYVTTNAHHSIYYYANDPVIIYQANWNDVSKNGDIILYQNTHPIVYIQAGYGPGVLQGLVGHGIFGIGGVDRGSYRTDWSHKWHADTKTFEFDNRDGGNTIGIVAVNEEDKEAEPYSLINDVMRINYELENVEETVWQWYKQRKDESMGELKLFKEEKQWKPFKFTIIGEEQSRENYFKKVNIAHPAGVVGTKDISTGEVRNAAGAWPFQYNNKVPGERAAIMTGIDFLKTVDALTFNVFFDPAAIYRLMVDAPPPIDLEYIDYPYADVSGPA